MSDGKLDKSVVQCFCVNYYCRTEIKSDQVQHDGKMKLLNTKISERTRYKR